MSASENHTAVLVFVDQAVIMGNDAPTQRASVVQVTLEKDGNRWLVTSRSGDTTAFQAMTRLATAAESATKSPKAKPTVK
jgi:hypothetical protein